MSISMQGSRGSSTTHNQQTPEVLIATVPEIALTSISVTKASLSNQRVTEYSSAQPRAPETVPGPNHVMGIPILQLMPAFPKNPCTKLQRQGFLPSSSQSQHSVCWQNHSIPIELEGNNRGPLGPPYSLRRVPYSSHSNPCVDDSPLQPSLFREGTDLVEGGAGSTPDKASSSESTNLSEGLLLQHVHGAQDGWWSETSHQPKSPEQPRESRAFQNGGLTYSQSPSAERGLDDQDRLEGHILYDTHGSAVPPAPPIQTECRVIPVQVPPIWAVHSPQSLHEDS